MLIITLLKCLIQHISRECSKATCQVVLVLEISACSTPKEVIKVWKVNIQETFEVSLERQLCQMRHFCWGTQVKGCLL